MKKNISTYIQEWVNEVAIIIKKEMENTFLIEEKSNKNDLVTHVDKLVERYFVAKIKENFPKHYILSEEGYGNFEEGVEGTVWIIDPIDGTLNFVHQKENFAISVAVFQDGKPLVGVIYDVMKNDLFLGIKGEGAYLNGTRLEDIKESSIDTSLVGLNARWLLENRRIEHIPLQKLVRNVRGTRSYGSATIEFMSVAKGSLNLYIAPRLGAWDFAASKVIIEELGGAFLNLMGEEVVPFNYSSIIAGPKNLVAEVLKNEYIKEK